MSQDANAKERTNPTTKRRKLRRKGPACAPRAGRVKLGVHLDSVVRFLAMTASDDTAFGSLMYTETALANWLSDSSSARQQNSFINPAQPSWENQDASADLA